MSAAWTVKNGKVKLNRKVKLTWPPPFTSWAWDRAMAELHQNMQALKNRKIVQVRWRLENKICVEKY